MKTGDAIRDFLPSETLKLVDCIEKAVGVRVANNQVCPKQATKDVLGISKIIINLNLLSLGGFLLESIMELRDEIVDVAREWLGTPWVHNQACKGVGVDCIQFVRAVAIAVGADPVPTYNYHRIPKKDSLQQVFETNPNFVRVKEIEKGNILVLRIAGLPHHVAIATSESTMIHADNRGGVVEHNIGFWANRVLGIYKLVL